VVLAIDVERERISLGIKQLEGDPFTNFIATHDKNSIVKGTVKSVDAARRGGAAVRRGRGLPARLRGCPRARRGPAHAAEGRRYPRRDDHQRRPQVAFINLSIKAKDQAEQNEAMQKLRSETSSASSGTTNLGALLKAKLGNPAITSSGEHDQVGAHRGWRDASRNWSPRMPITR
jgi:small subunit ribosomal protein S1